MRTSSPQQKLMDISSITSKILRKNFGRGPETCYAYTNGPYLVFCVRGFLSPLEITLLDHGQEDTIQTSRNIVMTSILTQLKGVLEVEFGQDVKKFYNDWIFIKNTGMITVEFEGDISNPSEHNTDKNIDSSSLIKEVERISTIVQKRPEQTEVFSITPKLHLVKRKGILVEIEKALVKKGFEMELTIAKNELEKSYFLHNSHFAEIFRSSISDVFVDWNFDDDDSIICFCLK